MLNPDFRDMLSALIEEDVEFLVVGAYALAAHGVPRATGDLDFWVRSSEENASRLIRALKGIEVPVLGADDLIRNKKAVGRTRDLADIEELERLDPGSGG